MTTPNHPRTSLTVRFDDPALLDSVKIWAAHAHPRLSLNAAANYLLSVGLLVARADRNTELVERIDTAAAVSEIAKVTREIATNLGISLDSPRNY